jgi:hypothetical protein
LDVIEVGERRPRSRRSLLLAVLAAIAVGVSLVAVVVSRQSATPSATPTPLAGWPAVGARAKDAELRTTAWRAWANRDPSVQLDRTTTLFAENWQQGHRTVVLLATQDSSGTTRIAVVLVNGAQAERLSARPLPADAQFVTEVIEANGQSAVLAVSPGMRSAVVSTAVVGAARAEDTAVEAVSGVLIPVAVGRTATRIVLKGTQDTILADRVPGADSSPQTPPAPLILRETVEGGRHVQFRSDGSGLTCRVVLADRETEAPAQVDCSPVAASVALPGSMTALLSTDSGAVPLNGTEPRQSAWRADQ